MMEKEGKDRASHRYLTVFFVLLGCSVFLWGLQYKLSLYDPPQASSHSVPTAKLLSNNERTDASAQSNLSLGTSPNEVFRFVPGVALFALLGLCVISYSALSRRALLDYPPVQLRQVLRETFFVRPPPVLS